MYLVHIALKNLLREKRRTIMSSLMFTVGIAGYIVLAGMFEGMDKQSIENLVRLETGHMKLRSSAYDEDDPFKEGTGISNYQELMQSIEEQDFAKSSTPRLLFLSELDNGKDSVPVISIGIDPKSDAEVFSLQDDVAGEALVNGSCYIGKQLAKDLSLEIGDFLYSTFRTREGMISSYEFELRGIMTSASPLLNSGAMVLTLADAQRGLETDEVTEISIVSPDLQKVSSYKESAQTLYPGLLVKTWKEQAEDYASITAIKKKSGSMILLFLIAIGMIGIVNTMIISVYRQKREIGTFKALGLTDAEVRNIFLFEAIIIGTLGAGLGLIVGSLGNLYFVVHGIDFDAYATSEGQSIMPNIAGVIYSVWVPSAYFTSITISLIGSLLASYFPAKRVMRLSPVECLRINQ